MRLITLGVGVAALLASSSAWAAPTGGGAGNKGDTGGKGGVGPQTSTQSGSAGSAEQSPTQIDTTEQALGGKSTLNPDLAGTAPAQEKAWEVAGTFEVHRLLESQYLDEGVGPFQTFNVLFVTARYDLTRSDSLAISGGGYQYFLADSGESGFRASDISLSYSHTFELPAKLRLRATGALTAPISYDSQLASNITSPSVTLALSRRFGDLLLQGNVRGIAFWDKYAEASSVGSSTNSAGGASSANGVDPGGQINPEWAAGGSVSAEYSMPFHRQLSIGAVLTDSYTWYYGGGDQAPAGTQYFGATQNPVTDNQPWQQTYGGEVFLRYLMPDLSGFKSDFTLAFANGDPSPRVSLRPPRRRRSPVPLLLRLVRGLLGAREAATEQRTAAGLTGGRSCGAIGTFSGSKG